MTQSAISRPWTKLIAYFNQGSVIFLCLFGLLGLYFLRDPDKLDLLGWSSLISMGFLGVWRWAWLGFHLLRANIYEHFVFPRWRRKANKIPLQHLPHICLLVPTYKEKPWITEAVFKAIAKEAKTLTHPLILLTVSSGPEEDAAIVKVLRSEDPELKSIRVIHGKDPGGGKRQALSAGLRTLARLEVPQNLIVALMDGDSVLTPGALAKCLPFFNMFPRLGALTTDESPVVVGSYFFSEWFHLRFAQRHYQMCSISLSKKVLCLTGRFSLYRAEAVLNPSFATQLENDTLNDWLWGEFKFLSGDDKTTWYWLLQRGGYDLLYIPDALVYSLESISGSLTNRVYQNMRRWFGNMLRNGNRALVLGPGRMGFFVWWCLIDQRLSMWTSLVAPGFLIIAFLSGHWLAVGILCSWLMFSRCITLMLIFWGRESQLKAIHLPILLFSQWSSALIKIWTQMNLAQQRWFNRGDRKMAVKGSLWAKRLQAGTSRFLLISQGCCFVIFLFWLFGTVSPLKDATAFWHKSQFSSSSPATQVVAATDYGVHPSDGKDDAAPLQALLQELPEQGLVQINLPLGELDFFQPLEISRSDTWIKGQGRGNTIVQSHIDRNNYPLVPAIVTLKSPDYQLASISETADLSGSVEKVNNIQLQGFTLQPLASNNPTDGIVMQGVTGATVKNVDVAVGTRHPLVLQQTEEVAVEYTNLDQQIVMVDAVATQIRGFSIEEDQGDF